MSLGFLKFLPAWLVITMVGWKKAMEVLPALLVSGGAFAAMQFYWEHMSHGQILDSGRNQGLDYVGLRFSYRFDPDAAN